MPAFACNQTTLLQWQSTSDERMEMPTTVPRQPKRRRAYCKVRFMSTEEPEDSTPVIALVDPEERSEEPSSPETAKDLERSISLSLPHSALLSLGLPSDLCGDILDAARTVPVDLGWFAELAGLAPDGIYMNAHYGDNERGHIRFHVIWHALKRDGVLNKLKEITAEDPSRFVFTFNKISRLPIRDITAPIITRTIPVRDISTIWKNEIFLQGLDTVQMRDICNDCHANRDGFFVRVNYRGSRRAARRAVEELELDWFQQPS